MNLDKLMAWIVAVVLLYATTGSLDQLQKWVWKAQGEILESCGRLTKET